MDRLTIENRQLAESAAMWQERARVLSDQLALAAPVASHTQHGAVLTPEQPAPITYAPVPLMARLRVLVPWVLAVLAILVTASVVGWPLTVLR